MNPNQTPANEGNDAEDIKKLLQQYLKYWPIFLFTTFIALTIAYVYLRYTPSIYQTNAKIQILKDKDGLMSGFQGASPLIDLSKVNLENETEIIKSRRIAEKVVDNLGLETNVKLLGTIRAIEIWGNEIPFEILWEGEDVSQLSTPEINIETTGTDKFKISIEDLNFKEEYAYGDLVIINNIELRLIQKPSSFLNSKSENKNYSIKKSSIEAAVTKLSSSVNIENIGDRSEVLKVSMNGQNKNKNEDIINALIEQFNEDGKNDNKKIAEQTEKFARERIEFLNLELDTVESSLVDFKAQNNLVNLESSVSELFAKSSESEKRLLEIEQQLLLVEEFKKDMDTQSYYELLPANIGIADRGVNEFTNQYNELVLTRQKFLMSSTPESSIIQQTDKGLIQLKQTIIRSLENYKRTLTLSKVEVQRQEQFLKSRLSSLPEKEKEIREISRQQFVKERLFLFLLQKREEAALSSAVMSDIAKVVDYAYTIPNAISPKPKIIYLGALLLGLLLPFGSIYIIFLLNSKVNSKEDILSIINDINIVGEVPILEKGVSEIVKKEDNHPVAESFRILRTNLNYIGLKQDRVTHDPKVIFVTSTIKGEGKTFTAVNLASTLASTNKKVVLIGADLRNPQIHNYFGLPKNREGLSKYLYDNTTPFDSILESKPKKEYGFELILSGQIPPNPTELLLNGRFEELISLLKETYDYIIVDTAPTILVTDSMLIADVADATLYLVRVGHTDAQLIQHLKDLRNKNKLKNIGVIVNGLKNKGAYAYNYGYGYGYNASSKAKKGFFSFFNT